MMIPECEVKDVEFKEIAETKKEIKIPMSKFLGLTMIGVGILTLLEDKEDERKL